jgi:hypothetical protein
MQESIVEYDRVLRRAEFSSRGEFLMVPRSFNRKKYVDKTMAEASTVPQQV